MLQGRRVALLLVSVWLISACSPSGDLDSGVERLTEELARRRLQQFVEQQRLDGSRVQFLPAEHDWAFLKPVVVQASSGGGSGGLATPLHPAMTIAYRSSPTGTRPCLRVGPYAVLVAMSESCPGDWVAYRADKRSTGTSRYRLNWSSSPRVAASIPLEVQQPADPLRYLAHNDARLGQRLYVNNGTSLEAFDSGGRKVWSTPGVGIGEVIDAVDLDGDGELEVVFSPGSRWNMLNPSGAGPGELIVLAARDGTVLWRYEFAGIEFGLNRRRTTIVPNAADGGMSIYAVMTYSPHLWRFDFSAGAGNGVLRWKSQPVVYDSPDKPPLVADFDGDGVGEVIIDSMGTLYAIRLADGAILSTLQYGPFHSFGGFATAVDLDGDGRREIVGMSNTIYMKDVFAARYTSEGFSLIWRKEWEHGLTTTNYDLLALPGVIRLTGSQRQFLIWSVRDLRNPGEWYSIELVDAATGIVVDRIDGAAYLQLLRDSDGSLRLAATKGQGAINVFELGPNGFGAETQIWASQWHGVAQRGSPTFTTDTTKLPSAALFVDSAGAVSLLTVGPGGHVTSQAIEAGFSILPAPLQHFDAIDGYLASDSRGRLLRVQSANSAPVWATYMPKVFGAPITADLDGDGRREAIVPFRRGTGIARFAELATARIDQIVAQSPDQQRESFHVPLIAWDSASGARVAVAFESSPFGFVATNAAGVRLWSWTLPATNWEPSLVIGADADGQQTIFYNDSRLTAAFDPGTGAPKWMYGTLGQCQRQIASIDWNGDGIADVAIQSAELIAVVDGAGGSPLALHSARTSYGGYVAAARTATGEDTAMVAVHAIGGMTLVDSKRGVMLDEQLDDRKVESIPPVIGRVGSGVEEALFQISGTGRLRIMTLEGAMVAERDLGVPALTMTGAYVDGDGVVDLLVSTYQGELLAVSGATLQVMWRIQLDGSPGPAVATDIEGDGLGEIVVITSDGQLRVLRPAA